MFSRCHLPETAGRTFRALAGLAGIFLLLLQLLGPALASPGQGVWMEICSEAGAVWVQVDPEEETDDPAAPCPKCADCALCAVTSAAPLANPVEVALREGLSVVHPSQTHICNPYVFARLWPETRGPPCETQHRTERAPRASMASTQVTGGAPWS